MVLFKRKPVQFLPPVEIHDENIEVRFLMLGDWFMFVTDALLRLGLAHQGDG